MHLATPPGASLGNKEITASLESGAIAPTTITVGSMTFGGSTLASIRTINSSPTITGTLTISGTGTSTIASSLQVASYLTSGNLLTVPYFTATSTTATSTLATGGLAIGTNQFVVQQSSGRVGLGTTSPYARLSIVGPAVAEYFHATSTTATSTFTGQLLVNHTPETPHTFGVWSTGTGNSGLPDAALLINPPAAASDSNLLALGVGGAVRFLIDAEGDVFANGLTTVGGATLASTTASTFTVENSLIAGDAANADAHTFRGTISHYATSSSAALTIWNSDTGDLLTLQGDTPAPVTRLTVTNAGNLGLGTTSPGSLLALQGIANFAPVNSFLFSPLTLPSFTATSTTATSWFAGGISTAGLASSNGLTLTGGSLLQTNTATSSLAGGLALTHLAASNGLTLTGGILNSTVAA
ncbi:MAG: hypothetical protein U0974_13300, partial [Gemmatimonadales bacterium]|nr:hypothetical protein [Gemmatimonadales bacterium]